MRNKLKKCYNEVQSFNSSSLDEIENFRISFLGKKGKITLLFNNFKLVPVAEKKEFGSQLNILKNNALNKVKELKSSLAEISSAPKSNTDFTIPGQPNDIGSRHPITIIRDRIINIFSHIGFSISEGPEIEDDWHNFTALNFPKEHPARDMQDTFFINEDIALRTHTSSVQVRVMEKNQPPIRTISPGRVYRNEAISARAHCFFHQVEGLYIDKGVSFADMKQTLMYFTKAMFGNETKIRLRPSYFPFTEPSAEVDVYWGLKSEADYRITKGTGWLEILGCGMVDPNVLTNCGIDPNKYYGFAF